MSYFDSRSQADSFLDSVFIGEDDQDPKIYTDFKRIREMKSITSSRYESVVEHVNNHRYKLINIPDITAERSSYELDPNTGGPVKLPFGNEVSQGSFSINWMIQSFAKQIPFEFVYWKDCVEVAAILHEYVRYLEDQCSIVDPSKLRGETLEEYNEAVGYVHMAKTLDDYLFPLARRLHYHYTSGERKRKKTDGQVSRLEAALGIKEKVEEGIKSSLTEEIVRNKIAIYRRTDNTKRGQ